MTAPAPDVSLTIVIPVHNRKDVTLGCLDNLQARGIDKWARIVVVDDGSTDGTAEAIADRHPGVVVERGDGSLWWSGAIQRGMDNALAHGSDYVLWLNDDCQPRAGTIEALVDYATAHPRTLVSARTINVNGGQYGGFRKGLSGAQPIPDAETGASPCDATNGNCVCIPREAVEAAGPIPAEKIPQYFGDSHFTMAAREAGFEVHVLNTAVCDSRGFSYANYRSWLYSDVPLGKIWRMTGTPKSALYPRARFYYFWRHWGLLGMGTCIAPYVRLSAATVLRALVPQAWLRKMQVRKSKAWELEVQRRQAGENFPDSRC